MLYCKIIIIRGARIFVVFVGRSIHEFKIRRNFIQANTSYPVQTCFGSFQTDFRKMDVYQVSDRLNPFAIFKRLKEISIICSQFTVTNVGLKYTLDRCSLLDCVNKNTWHNWVNMGTQEMQYLALIKIVSLLLSIKKVRKYTKL
jgi:hypothetical protein